MFGKRVWINPLLAFFLVILLSLVVSGAMISIAPGRFSDFWRLSSEQGYITLWLNALPVLLITMLLFLVTGSFAVSVSLSGFFFFAFAFVNRTKMQFRGDPLLHWDFSLLREALGIAKSFPAKTFVLCFLFVAIFIIMAVWFCLTVRTAKMLILPRVLMASACALGIVVCNQTFYQNEDIYNALPVYGNLYNLADVHTSKGNLYSFLINLNLHNSVKPDDYDPAWVRKQIANLDGRNPEAVSRMRPHIIAVMGESFSALSESSALDFADYRDPLKHFKELGEEGLMKRAIMPWKGGGTGDAEFDFLTGFPSRWFASVPYAYRMVMKPIEALPSILEQLGYKTFALHPGYRWFYNRQNVYPNLGFSKMVFEDDFPSEAYRGAFITEKATIDKLLEMMEDHLANHPGVPMFGFCVTIENHVAYEDRFLLSGMENFSTSLLLTSQERNILGNYLEGVRQADLQLERLATWLEALEEPAVLLYYGDHLPSLNDNLYDMLIAGSNAPEGSFVQETRLFDVPFLLWQNKAAASAGVLDMDKAQALLPENGVISSNYLGAYLLEALGFDAMSPFFQYVNELRQSHPVILGDAYFDGEEHCVKDSGNGEGEMRLYRGWVCYRLMDE